MKRILLFVFCLTCISSLVQAQTPESLVQFKRQKGAVFSNSSPFKKASIDRGLEAQIEVSPDKYELLELDVKAFQELRRSSPEALNLSIPYRNGAVLELELARVNILTPDFALRDARSGDPLPFQSGIYYRGVIKNAPQSFAAISILEDEVRGLLSSKKGNLVLGKLKGKKNRGKHIIYQDKEVMHAQHFDCQTVDDGVGYTKEELYGYPSTSRSSGDCVRLYFEIDHDIYEDFNEELGAVFNFVSGLFNEMGAIYSMEDISVSLSEVSIWTDFSPYTGSTATQMLDQFQLIGTQFNGDLGQLLSRKVQGQGEAAGVHGLCNANSANSLCFSGIDTDFQMVPTYSLEVYLVTHEFGHLFGSRHTHACVWNGNNTAIDGCAGFTEKNACPVPEIPEIGTLMSYCHRADGVNYNFTLGFGDQPGNVIRSKVANAACLSNCNEVGCQVTHVISSDVIPIDGFVQAQVNIIANNEVPVGEDLIYQAGEYVDLKPGFHARMASFFEARIGDCTPEDFLSVEGRTNEHVHDMDEPDEDGTLNKELSLSVYPNPLSSNGNIKIYLPGDGEISLMIYDLRGRAVKRLLPHNRMAEGTHMVAFDVNDLTPGIYLCYLKTEQEVKVARFSVI